MDHHEEIQRRARFWHWHRCIAGSKASLQARGLPRGARPYRGKRGGDRRPMDAVCRDRWPTTDAREQRKTATEKSPLVKARKGISIADRPSVRNVPVPIDPSIACFSCAGVPGPSRQAIPPPSPHSTPPTRTPARIYIARTAHRFTSSASAIDPPHPHSPYETPSEQLAPPFAS